MRRYPPRGMRHFQSTFSCRTIITLLLFLMFTQDFPLTDLKGASRNDCGRFPEILATLTGWMGPEDARAQGDGYGGEEPSFDLSARAKPGKIQLVWNHLPGIIRYDVFRSSEFAPSSFQKIAETTSTYSTYLDLTVTNEVTYLYRISAVFPESTVTSEVVSGHAPAGRTVGNYNPVIFSEPVTRGTETYFYRYVVEATDPNRDTLSYSLSLAPDGMTIDPYSGTISWLQESPGSYSVRVEVSDGRGGIAFQELTVEVEPRPNQPPTADPGFDRTVCVFETVQLYGNGSSDPDWDPLSYQWSFVSVPQGSAASLSGPGTVNPTFVADLAGEYVVRLIVNDGREESAPATVTITALIIEPTARISAGRETINPGRSVMLHWNVTYADTCTLDPGIGTVPCVGSMEVIPAGTSTYTLTATSRLGTVGASVQVVVLAQPVPPPTATLVAETPTITPGSWARLSWYTTDADHCEIEPSWVNSVPCNGHVAFVRPSSTTEYQLIVEGPGGYAWTSATVTVTDLVSIAADPPVIQPGQSTTLTWTSTDAETVAIDQGIGSVPSSGSITVTPAQTTTYTITASSPRGVATARVTVPVRAIDPAPTVSISANPVIIQAGQSTTLTWSTTHAESVTIDQGIGNVAANGSTTVAPTQDTTYTIVATGPGGTATASVAVSVTESPPTVSISASPTSIQVGQSTTLTWSSTHAENVTIDQGIGSVGENGSWTLFPSETTTYTITATGPGGTATASAVVTVTHPAPTVSISVDPASIQAGESATLTWSSTHAASVTIDPGLGDVGENGSWTLFPSETTTYTITATGPGGMATASALVTVTHPAPTVSISVDPASIQAGESVTLTWSSTHAESVTIDPGVGGVSENGSWTLSPSETTTYTITATGPGGAATASVTVTVSPILLRITAPLENEWISGRSVMVQGMVTNATGAETGVTVNGVIAEVYGNEFVANHVPLVDGENTFTATATDIQGNTVTATIPLQADTTGDQITLSAVSSYGVSPFETMLRVSEDGRFSPPTLSYGGPGPVEVTRNADGDDYTVRIGAEGIYLFTVEAADTQGNVHRDSIAMVVQERALLDDLLRAKWDTFKQKLADGATEEGLTYFLERSRDRYRTVFNALSGRLPELVSQMQDIEMVQCRDGAAEYRIERVHLVNAQPVTITYSVFFRRDEKGIWKIDKF